MVGLEYYLLKSWLKPRIQALGVPHASRGSTLKMPRPRQRVCLENGLKPLGTSFSEPSLKGCEQAAHPYRDSREPQRAEIEASSPADPLAVSKPVWNRMPMSRPLKVQIVESARALIADEEHWCRGELARDARGMGVCPMSDSAIKRCSL